MFAVDRSAVLWVFAGSMAGAPARYAIGEWWPVDDGGLPWPTLVINVGGAFALGLLLSVLTDGTVGRPLKPESARRKRLRLLAGTGFLGAFTTYSSFAVELDLLVHAGRAGLALGYAALALSGGVLAATAGIALGIGWSRRRMRT